MGGHYMHTEGMGLKLTPVVVRCLLGPDLCRLIASPNSPNKKFNPPPAAHHSPPLTPPHPLTHATHDITVVVKKSAQNPAVLAS